MWFGASAVIACRRSVEEVLKFCMFLVAVVMCPVVCLNAHWAEHRNIYLCNLSGTTLVYVSVLLRVFGDRGLGIHFGWHMTLALGREPLCDIG